MKGKLPVVTSRRLIRALERKGWEVDRVRGSHYIMIHRALGRAVPIPFHNRDLKRGTLTGILRAVDLSAAELRELL